MKAIQQKQPRNLQACRADVDPLCCVWGEGTATGTWQRQAIELQLRVGSAQDGLPILHKITPKALEAEVYQPHGSEHQRVQEPTGSCC